MAPAGEFSGRSPSTAALKEAFVVSQMLVRMRLVVVVPGCCYFPPCVAAPE